MIIDGTRRDERVSTPRVVLLETLAGNMAHNLRTYKFFFASCFARYALFAHWLI